MGNMLDIDFSNFNEYAERLEQLGADLQEIFDKILLEAAETVQEETKEAMAASYMPAHGKYSRGKTESSIVEPKVEWNGSIAEVNLGFDKSKPGAGGFLITGTPMMRPNARLSYIYASRGFENKINKEIKVNLQKEIDKRMNK